ncbi:MAG: GNVR domain-containing protein [Pseudomonadota bacterium]
MSTAEAFNSNQTLRATVLQLLEAGWRRRWLIIVPLLVLIPMGILANFVLPKSYVARTLIVIKETAKHNPLLEDLAIGLNIQSRMDALQSLLRSEHILLSVLQRNGTVTDATPPAEVHREIKRLGDAVSLQLAGRDLIELRLRGTDPEGMGTVLNLVMHSFLRQLLSPEQSQLTATQTFLKAQLAARETQLKAAKTALAAFKRKHADALPQILDADIEKLKRLDQDLQQARLELSGASASLKRFKQQLITTNPMIARLDQQIVALVGELTELGARYTPQHSRYASVQRRLERLQERRTSLVERVQGIDDGQLQRLLSVAAEPNQTDDTLNQQPFLVTQLLRYQETEAKVSVLQQSIAQLEERRALVQHRIAEYGPYEQQIRQLETDVRLQQELYEKSLQRSEQARASGALSVFEAPDRVKIIDPPADPTAPRSPGLLLFLVIAVFSGVMIGAGLAFAAELLDDRVHTTADVEALLGKEVLAVIPYLPPIPLEADQRMSVPA